MEKIRSLFTLFILVFVFSMSLNAQNFDGLYRSKVKSLDSTIETLYAVISGDQGVKRDWDLFKYLFVEGAQLTPILRNSSGQVIPRFMSPDDYVTGSGSYLEENGFFEKEIFRVTEEYGALTHVFSTYESYRTSTDTEPFARGINSIQCMFDGSRWWIVNITWQGEYKDIPIPEKYLPGK